MSRSTILHIEDDSNDVLLLQHACRKASDGLLVRAVTDGDEAMAYLKGEAPYANRQENPLPDVVLLDLKMPRVNGFEVLAWMRRQQKLRVVPVIVLTSSNHEADIKRAYEMGANSYLVKPVGFDALVSLVKILDQYWFKWNERPPR